MCKLEKCPRCKNENLEEGQNYCHICGLDLKRAAQEVPVQEQSEDILTKLLRQEKEARAKIDRGEIKEGSIEYVNDSLDINLSEKQFQALAISDFTTKEYRLIEILRVLKILNII